MASPRYEELVEQLAILRNHLLPAEFDPTGLYDDAGAISTKALAFRVLAHAEVESFFEDRALETVSQARAAWLKRRYVSRTVLCLLGFSGRAMEEPPSTLQAPSENKRKAWPELIDISERIAPIIAAFHHFVRNENHGIKEKNLLSLLIPIGVDHRRIDPAFLADMESFGALRGVAAHTSTRTVVRQGLNPADELKRVEALLNGIAALDSEINNLLADVPADEPLVAAEVAPVLQ